MTPKWGSPTPKWGSSTQWGGVLAPKLGGPHPQQGRGGSLTPADWGGGGGQGPVGRRHLHGRRRGSGVGIEGGPRVLFLPPRFGGPPPGGRGAGRGMRLGFSSRPPPRPRPCAPIPKTGGNRAANHRPRAAKRRRKAANQRPGGGAPPRAPRRKRTGNRDLNPPLLVLGKRRKSPRSDAKPKRESARKTGGGNPKTPRNQKR